MTKWLYSTCFINELPMMGEAGWEAYALHRNDGKKLIAYLKRPQEKRDVTIARAPQRSKR